jgi:hypothetical protein
MEIYPMKVLTELCEVLSGGTPKTTNPAYWNDLVPWASLKDFNTGNRWFNSTEEVESENDEDFQTRMDTLITQLSAQLKEFHRLEALISKQLKGLDYGL